MTLRAFIPATVLTVTATTVVWYLLGSPTSGVDDANIFLAYAQNLSGGHGFVFNAGGERVEGFTSLLWVLLCAAAVGLSSNPEVALLAISVTLLATVAILCIRSSVLSHGAETSTAWAGVFLVLLFSDYRFVAWNTITLMDTSLWCCLLTISAFLATSDRLSPHRLGWSLAGVTVVLILTRPEAVLWAAVVILLLYFKHALASDRAAAIRVIAPAAIAYASTIGALTVFRLSYFGFPLPNTFYAKVSPSVWFTIREGVRYFWGYVLSGPVPMLCALATCASTGHLFKVGRRDTRTLALTVLSAAGLLMPILTGGDHLGGYRFYQSVYPILLLALVNCVRFIIPQYVALPAAPRVRRAVMLIGTASLLGVFLVIEALEWTDIDQRTRLPNEFDIAEAGRARGWNAEALFGALHPRPSIGTITVGGLKYTYGGDVVDLMGLNNTRMAHNGGDRIGLRSHAAFEKRTFYELKPTMVVPLVQYSDDLSWLERRSSFVDMALKGLLDERRFRDAYRLAEVRKTTSAGIVAVAAWYKREFLHHLERSNEFEILLSAQP